MEKIKAFYRKYLCHSDGEPFPVYTQIMISIATIIMTMLFCFIIWGAIFGISIVLALYPYAAISLFLFLWILYFALAVINSKVRSGK